MKSVPINERVYRFMLRAYPATFRKACESELIDDFKREIAQPRYAGLWGQARFWRHTAADVARTAWSERREPRAGADLPASSQAGRWNGLVGLRFAARSLARDTTFSMVAIVTLAVGMSTTSVVFTIVHGLLLTPLPLPEPERLVQVEERQRDNAQARMAAYGNWLDLTELDVFENIATFAYSTKTLTGIDSAQRLRGREVSAGFFDTLDVSPAIGRTFEESEFVDGQHRSAILSHALWSGSFGSDPDVLGRTIQINAQSFTVVGVMEPGFDFPFLAQIWVPLRPASDDCMRRCHRYRMTGRLAAGVSLEAAQEALDVVSSRLQEEFPENSEYDYFAAYPLIDEYVGSARPALRMLSLAVGLVLLIACVNITSLSLARSSARRQEIAMRRALGASRWQLAGLVLSEGVVLGIAGGVLGIGLTLAALRTLVTVAASTIPRVENVALNGAVFLFVAAVSIACGVLVSLLPVLRESRVSAATAVTNRATDARGAAFLRNGLVMGQLAMAVILVAGAALLGRSLGNLSAVQTGAVTEGVITMSIALPTGKYEDGAAESRFFDALLPEIESIAGVERAAATLTLPANPFGWRNSLPIRSKPLPENEIPSISYVVTTPGYFDALSIPLLEGRTFRPSDDGTERVAILNRTAAETYWPEGGAVGAMVLGRMLTPEDPRWARVIGVVEDTRQDLLGPPMPEVYVPPAQDRILSYSLVARTSGDPTQHVAAIRDKLKAADADIPVSQIMTLDEAIRGQTADARFNTGLMSTFAGIALALAAVGVYGVLSYSVSLRRREFGVRTAVGASRGHVVGMVLRGALAVSVAAVTAGVLGSMALARVFSGMLFEVGPRDPLTLAGVAGAVVLVTVIAAFAPAWRAASTDPLTVLRSD